MVLHRVTTRGCGTDCVNFYRLGNFKICILEMCWYKCVRDLQKTVVFINFTMRGNYLVLWNGGDKFMLVKTNQVFAQMVTFSIA